MDLNHMIDTLGDMIAEGDYDNARKTINAIERYISTEEMHASPRLPELNDYVAHVHHSYYA